MLVPVVPLVGIGRLDPEKGACREAGVCEPKWLFAEFWVCISGPKWPDVKLLELPLPGSSIDEGGRRKGKSFSCSAMTEAGADTERNGIVSCGAQLFPPCNDWGRRGALSTSSSKQVLRLNGLKVRQSGNCRELGRPNNGGSGAHSW